MTENVKKLFEAASKDAQLKEKLTAAQTVEAVIAIAKENGIELTEEDLKRTAEEELTDDALEQAAGGVEMCFCMVGGGATGVTDDKQHTCACVICGEGGKGRDDPEGIFCIFVGL